MPSSHHPKRTLEMRWSHQVETKPIDWLWQPWLARGVVAVLDGDPGMGKSSLTMDLVARVTTGRAFPSFDGKTPPIPEPRPPTALEKSPFGEPRSAIIVALEDSLDRVVVPRLQAAGADPTKALLLGGVRETISKGEGQAEGEIEMMLQLPRDLDLIAAACRELRPALLVIDPLFAVLGYDERGRYVKATDDQSVRRLTSRLKKMAEELAITVVLVRHLTKASGGNAIKRGSGSIAIAGQARAVMLVAREPEGADGTRVLAMTKSNLAATPRSLLFQVVGHGPSSRVEWLGESPFTADQLIRPDTSHDDALACAVFFLKHTLNNAESSWENLVQLAREEGISEITLRRARAEIGLKKRFVREHHCVWTLPMSEQIKLF